MASIDAISGGNIEPRGLEEEMRSAYLDYAMSVIVGRALPDVRDIVVSNRDAVSQPLVAASAARMLVATALATFPNNALTDPTAEDRRDASPPVLRRAVAFIEENARLVSNLDV